METMNWYSIRITRDDQLRGKADRLVGEIQDLFRLLDADPSRAVYSSPVNDQTVNLYFSPTAAACAMDIILKYWGAESAAPPSTAKLVFGSSEALTQPPDLADKRKGG